MSATFSTSTQLFQHFLGDFHPRKLLLHTSLSRRPLIASPPSSSSILNPLESNVKDNNSFNADVIMVLLVLICALVCSVGLNSIIRCALRCSGLIQGNSAARLVSTGIKAKALKTFPIVNYTLESKFPGLDTECVICLSEFALGDRLRILPKCSHGFHVRCIDKWLSSHSSCPTCRHCLMETCQKIAGCSQASTSDPPPPQVQESLVSIAPLEREGLVRNYREIS